MRSTDLPRPNRRAFLRYNLASRSRLQSGYSGPDGGASTPPIRAAPLLPMFGQTGSRSR